MIGGMGAVTEMMDALLQKVFAKIDHSAYSDGAVFDLGTCGSPAGGGNLTGERPGLSKFAQIIKHSNIGCGIFGRALIFLVEKLGPLIAGIVRKGFKGLVWRPYRRE